MKTLLAFCAIALTISLSAQETNYTLDGNLGLGTNPETKLDVNGDSRMDGKLTVTDKTQLDGDADINGALKVANLTTAETGYILVVDEQGTMKKMPPEDVAALLGDLALCQPNSNAIWRGGINKLYTCPEQTRVGIGTETPAFKLDVQGDASVKTNLTLGGVDASLSPFLLRVNANQSGGIGIAQNTTSLKRSFCIENNASNVFEVFSNGVITSQLGDGAWNAMEIRKADGTEILRVNPDGELMCTKVRVRMTPFPDYVFESDYKLMSLKELKEYVERNKHLPNMPSSTEVAEKGGDIGEISRVSVEKIEELTLYIFQLQEQIESLQEKVETLEKQTK